MPGSLRCNALALYRRVLRSARTWPGPEEEKQYILQEGRHLFRQNRLLLDTQAIKQKVAEGNTRVDIAWHYLIPYPRLHHQKQSKYREAPILSSNRGSQRDNSDSKSA